jgi:hypothetical protein
MDGMGFAVGWEALSSSLVMSVQVDSLCGHKRIL